MALNEIHKIENSENRERNITDAINTEQKGPVPNLFWYISQRVSSRWRGVHDLSGMLWLLFCHSLVVLWIIIMDPLICYFKTGKIVPYSQRLPPWKSLN